MSLFWRSELRPCNERHCRLQCHDRLQTRTLVNIMLTGLLCNTMHAPPSTHHLLAAGNWSSPADLEGDVAFAAMLSGTDQAWILDSGASRHITGDSVAGARAKAEAQGDIVLEIAGSGVDIVTLLSVLYVPEAKMNLLSISKAMEKGVNPEFAGQSCRMLQHGRLLAEAKSSCGIYGMQKSMVQGMTTTAAEFKTAGQEACGTCITAKQHKQPRPSSASDSHKPLELLHTDVCG